MTDETTFEYVVYGRPISTQLQLRESGGKPKKSAALPRWRKQVKEAFESAWQGYSKEVLFDDLRLELIWVFDTRTSNVPDLDNIVKPFIDIPQGVLYGSDLAFREMHLRKIALAEAVTVEGTSEKLAEALASRREFVYIRITAMSVAARHTLTLPPVGGQ